MKNTDFIINGKNSKPKTISSMIYAFSNFDILNTYGGYIFTFRIHNNITYLGVKPAIIEGRRSNHYNLEAGPDTKLYLTGGINTNGEISLLFKIPLTELTTGIKSELRELYINFSNFLIINKLKGSGKLDWITRKIIEESGLFLPIPSTIFNLNKTSNLSL